MTPRLRSRALAVMAATALVAAAATPAAAAPVPADGLTVIAVKHSILGTHTWYQQTLHGIPVLGGFYATHSNDRPGAVEVQDGRIPVSIASTLSGGVAQDRAQAEALNRTGGTVLKSHLVILPGNPAALAWRVVSD